MLCISLHILAYIMHIIVNILYLPHLFLSKAASRVGQEVSSCPTLAQDNPLPGMLFPLLHLECLLHPEDCPESF